MSRWTASLRLLRRAGADFSLRSRLHLLGRFLTCPFLPVVDAIPPGAVVLDLGAGHGALARLAVEAGARQVVAVEPDLRKMGSVLRHPAVRWVCGFDGCVAGRFGAVVLCDVLYRVPLAERDALLGRVKDRLEPGGLLIVKEIDPEHRVKFLWNVAQETVAIRLLRMTLGAGMAFEGRQAFAQRLERAGLTEIAATAIDAGYPHSHILFTARRPA